MPMAGTADALTLLAQFVRGRWGYRFASRDCLLRWQARQLSHFMRRILPQFPFYKTYLPGRDTIELAALPVLDKSQVREHFTELNRYGIDRSTALAEGLAAERSRDFTPTLPHGVSVGLSSGTSGERGVFLVSRQESSRWAGAVLAKLLSRKSLRQLLNPLAPALRVAFLLRANSNLYARLHSRRLQFNYLDLLAGIDGLVSRLNQLQPHVLIAPASVLGVLALRQDNGLDIRPQQVVSVAETLEPDDAGHVSRAWHVPLQEAYQCTEGFLAASCERGRLHLNEELVHIEPQWLDAGQQRFMPIITDFSRRTQAFVRYRLDDVLRVDAEQDCPCGRHTRTIAAIEGRHDDVLWLPDLRNDALTALFPDSLRRAMLLAQDCFSDYCLEQHALTWLVRIQPGPGMDTGQAEARIECELAGLCRQLRLRPPAFRFAPWQPAEQDSLARKRRRIHCRQKPVWDTGGPA
jgi:putative adenylate-forming enzyme